MDEEKRAHPAGTVLVVEDEPNIADILGITLRFHGFEVLTAATGREAIDLGRSRRPDLVLLDVMLPDMSGWQVCRALRPDEGDQDVDDIAVIFLTARDAHQDIVGGLALGGDDYVTKPFNVDELLARVRSVLRRSRRREVPRPRVLTHADVEMDEATYTVTRAGHPVPLTPTEYNLLRHLLLNAGRIVPKEQILQHVWSWDRTVDSSVVETYVSYLRRKLGRYGEPLIVTRRGVGYGLQSAADR